MSVRYVLAPEAALDLVKIWRYIKKRGSVEMADRVEAVTFAKRSFFWRGLPAADTGARI